MNRFDNLQGSLADVIGTSRDVDYNLDDFDEFEGFHAYGWDAEPDYDWDWDNDPEPDPYEDYEYDEAPPPDDDLGHDPYEHLPHFGKVSLAACLGGRTQRPACRCCGGFMGVRRSRTRRPKFNIKPKRKDHRQ